MRQTAVNMADDGVAEVHEALGNAALGHGVAGEGVERNGEQRPAVHTFKHTLSHGDKTAAVKEDNAAHCGQAERNADRHTQHHHYGKAYKQPCYHFAISSLGSVFSVRVTSR